MKSRLSKHCKKEQCEKCEDVDCTCGCHGLFEDPVTSDDEDELEGLEKELKEEDEQIEDMED